MRSHIRCSKSSNRGRPRRGSFCCWRPLRRVLPIRDDAVRARTIRAIVGSAALFACVHANVWPTPIPLAILALVLGWLAVRTQSIVAPIVVHILFNAVAFMELALS